MVDVSDLGHPLEVASFHLDGAGTHNFWMDEAHQILYAAYYNGGVVALDVSGTLEGDLSEPPAGQIRPGGDGNTYIWGVQLADGSLYAIDMLSGLWQLGAWQPSSVGRVAPRPTSGCSPAGRRGTRRRDRW